MSYRQTEDGKTLRHRQTDRGWKDIETQTDRQRMERH